MAVLVSGARTPIGKLLGSLAGFSAVDLGGVAIKGALDKAGVQPNQVEYVIMGQVLQAGSGQIPARQAAVKAGVPMNVPALTINKVCLSGLDAIVLAGQYVDAGEFNIVVAGGMESMTNAPHLLMNSRQGHKYGDVNMLDHLAHDGLHDAFTDQPMGALTEAANTFSRAEQDTFSAQSHHRAAAAWKDGVFDDEVVPVEIPQRERARRPSSSTRRSRSMKEGEGEQMSSVEPAVFDHDEGVRADTSVETLARLRPAFGPDGTITAGSASQISDGACAVVVMSDEKAAELGVEVLAHIGKHGFVAGPDSTLQSQPAAAIQAACAKDGVDPGELDVVEINEAFASVVLASSAQLELDPARVNINGGAIALGHPIGMSGARLALHLALELRRRGGGVGAAALCGGGGQGDALILRTSRSVGDAARGGANA